MTHGILEDIVEKRQHSINAARSSVLLETLVERCKITTPAISFSNSLLESEKPALIAEMKRASPSGGILDMSLNPLGQTDIYCQSGASAISVLTENHYFKGTIEDLQIASQQSHKYNIPVLRKDFIIDKYQIFEARQAGADAILLIISILDDDSYKEFYDLASSLGMDVLVEVFDENELDKALKITPTLIGINNRNLKTLKTSLTVFESLVKSIPKNCIKIAESGIKTFEDVKRMGEAGADAILVGEALMKSNSPSTLTSTISQKKAQ